MLQIGRFSRILPSKYTIYRTGDTGTEKGSYSSLKSSPHALHLVVSFLACTDATVKSSWTALYRFRMKPEWPEIFIGEFALSWWGEQDRGGSRIFLRRGCTRLLLYFNTNKPHGFLFLQNTSCIRKPQVISGGGEVRTPCTLPLDPALQEELNM